MGAKVILLVFGMCLLFARISSGQDTNAQPDRVTALRLAYEKAIAKGESDCMSGMLGLTATHLKDLENLQRTLQKAGDLDGFTAVGQEMERFKAEQRVPEVSDAQTLDQIKLLQIKYWERQDKLALDKDTRIVAAAKQYIEKLTELQKNLTKAGRIDDALAVNVVLKQAGSDPKVRDAEFAIAAHEADSKKKGERTPKSSSVSSTEKKVAETKPSSGGTVPAGQANTAAAKAGPDGITIYEGKSFPTVKGASFKALSLMATAHISGAPKLSVTAMLDTESNMEKRKSTYYSSTSRSKSGTMVYSLRVTVKSANKGYALDDAKMLVEYFAKDLSDSGKVSPAMVRTNVVSLPKIDGERSVGVGFPAVSLNSSSYRRTGRYSSGKSESGQVLYGVIVSVFDADGTLIYQTGSNNTLKDFGATKLP